MTNQASTNPSPPTAVADLPTETIAGHPIPVVTTGELRPVTGENGRQSSTHLRLLFLDISTKNAIVQLRQSGIPGCYILGKDLWSGICEQHTAMKPATYEETGSRNLQTKITPPMLQAYHHGTHTVVGTQYNRLEAWAVVYVPLSWGEEVIKTFHGGKGVIREP